MHAQDTYEGRRTSALWGALRLLALLGLALLFSVAFSIRTGRAAMEDRLFEVGEHLEAVVGATTIGGYELALNGTSLHYEVAHTPLSLEETVTRFEAGCQKTGALEARGERPLRLAISEIREQTAIVACLDTGATLSSFGELVERLGAFGRTGDLGAVGQLRYLKAQRGANRTRLLAFYSNGSLPLREMFPVSGDAPGSDLDAVPRPESSRRLLSASPESTGYTWVLYAQPHGAATIEYRHILSAAGWREQKAHGDAMVFVRQSRTLFVRKEKRSSGLVYSLAEAAPQGG